MFKFMLGFVLGFVIATIGVSGVTKILDNGAAEGKAILENQVKE